MKATNLKRQYAIEKNSSLSGVISGTLFDNELNMRNNGYLIDYHLNISRFHLNGKKCVIENANLCVGARPDKGIKPVDIRKEILYLKKLHTKYQKLSKVHPNTLDGVLTNKEWEEVFEKKVKDLEKSQQHILEQLELQIKDRLVTEETPCIVVDFRKITQTDFKHKTCCGKLQLTQAS